MCNDDAGDPIKHFQPRTKIKCPSVSIERIACHHIHVILSRFCFDFVFSGSPKSQQRYLRDPRGAPLVAQPSQQGHDDDDDDDDECVYTFAYFSFS